MASVGVQSCEFHLNCRHAAMSVALEVCEIPSRCNQVWTHALDSMNEHAMAVGSNCTAVVDDVATDFSTRPEAMDDVAIWFLLI